MRQLTLLWPMTDEPARAAAPWLVWYLRERTASCGHELFRETPDPVMIEDYGADVSLGFLTRIHIDFIRDDLRTALAPEINDAFDFGLIQHVRDGVVAGKKTYWPKSDHLPWLRGGMKSWCRRCTACDQVIYNPMGTWYVLDSDIPNAPIFSTDYGGIVIATEMLSRIDRKILKKVAVRNLPVYAKPKDGFPINLADITPELERVPPWTRKED